MGAPRPGHLLKRPQFQAVAASRHRAHMAGLVLQALPTDPAAPTRYGLTASRKVGGAVVRNRARRRLRALADQLIPALLPRGFDLVFIARPETATRPATLLRADCEQALKSVLRAGRRSPRPAG